MNLESISHLEDNPNAVPVPQQSLEFDKEKAESWINAEEDLEIRNIKRKIIEHIQHVPFSEFQKNAEEVMGRAVSELAQSDQRYALFFDYKPHSSKRWLYELTQNCFAHNTPAETGYFTPTWEKMNGNKNLARLVANGINTFFICDDAVYSGEQIVNRQINPIMRFYEDNHIDKKPVFIIAVPFVTSQFIQLIEKLKVENKCEIRLHAHSVMPTLAEILTDEEKKILETKRNGNLEPDQVEPTYLGATITYFDHRVADDHSFAGEVKKVLGVSAVKPYADESSQYFKKEDQEFNEYKEKVLGK